MSAALVAGLATASAQQCCTDSTAAKPRFTIGGYGAGGRNEPQLL
mgnify:CR=1 FL=1